MTPLQEIERDLDWREGEMALMRILLANKTVSKKEKLVLCRAGWALLYAHYEGFCKFALNVYYDALSKSGKKCRDLASQTQVFALREELKKVRNYAAVDLLLKIRSFEISVMGEAAVFPDVETDSNLWPSKLAELLLDADVEVPSVEENWHKLKTLVGRRNKIAHGEKDIIEDFSYYREFEEAVLHVMYDIALAIDEKLALV